MKFLQQHIEALDEPLLGVVGFNRVIADFRLVSGAERLAQGASRQKRGSL
jgi:hypothetical protein